MYHKKDKYMSLLDRLNKTSIGSTAAEHLIEFMNKHIYAGKYSFSNGILTISEVYKSQGKIHTFGYILKRNTEFWRIAKSAGVKEIYFDSETFITLEDFIRADKNIVIKSDHDIHITRGKYEPYIVIRNLNVKCKNLHIDSNDIELINCTIDSYGIYKVHESNSIIDVQKL